MGLSWPLIGFPLFCMIISILITSGSIGQGSENNGVSFNNGGGGSPSNSTATTDCTNFTWSLLTGGTPCFAGSVLPSTNIIVRCGNQQIIAFGFNCFILNTCPFGFQNNGGMFCKWAFNKLVMSPNTIVTLIGGQPQPATVQSFIFSTGIFTGDFTTWIVIIIGAVVLISATIFSSSILSTETSHILFEGGALIILWTFLTALEGSFSSNPPIGAFFSGLNGMWAGTGTMAYAVLSLVYAVGILRTISRSN